MPSPLNFELHCEFIKFPCDVTKPDQPFDDQDQVITYLF